MARSASSADARWARLIEHVLDDDRRTYRATVLISHLTIPLLVVSALVIGIVALLAGISVWIPVGTGGGLVTLTYAAAWLRRRRLGSATGPAGQEQSTGQPTAAQLPTGQESTEQATTDPATQSAIDLVERITGLGGARQDPQQ